MSQSASQRSVQQRSKQNKRRKRKRPANAGRRRIRSSVPELPLQRLSTSAKRKRGVIGRNLNVRSVLAARRSAKTKELGSWEECPLAFYMVSTLSTCFLILVLISLYFMHLWVKKLMTGRMGYLQGLAGIGRDRAASEGMEWHLSAFQILYFHRDV
ncbi:hypothetical protein BC826DRAFT_81779 [Russula brevipes]|nr:hypothetical protein BC826DRAFT_81779 [Russula brevipes]